MVLPEARDHFGGVPPNPPSQTTLCSWPQSMYHITNCQVLVMVGGTLLVEAGIVALPRRQPWATQAMHRLFQRGKEKSPSRTPECSHTAKSISHIH